ncbi:MAG: flagellar motor switch protein FliM [Alphaproteobacteria bacterium]
MADSENKSSVDEEALMAEWAEMAGMDDEGEGAPSEESSAGDESQDDMAAEWAATLENEGGDGEAQGGADGEFNAEIPGNGRVLDQDEIDSLLGFDDNIEEHSEKSGIQAILNSSMVSYERLPMLEIVFDRLVRMMSTSLRNFTQDNVEVALDNIISLRFGDYLNSIPLPAMLIVFKAEEWDNYGLMMIDSSMIYSVVDVLLGGRRGTAAMRIEGRPYTTIERNLVESMIHVVLADLSAAFDPLSPVTFRFDRLETNPRFATISRPSNAAIVAKLRIDMEDRGGRIELLIPYATLEPVRELLLQMFMGEKFGRDSIWETHLAEELWLTEVDMSAVLDQQEIMLRDVLSWQKGSRIMLNATPSSQVEVLCGDIPMFRGNMGRKGNKIAIKIIDKVKRRKT